MPNASSRSSPLLSSPRDLAGTPHRRFNPLRGDWVLVSPNRTERPWQGRHDPTPDHAAPRYDPGCYLCPGNQRAGGARNPAYDHTFIFDNDYPALLTDAGTARWACGPLLRMQAEPGRCRVICFSPRHDLTLAGMEPAAVERVVALWTDEYLRLGADPRIGHVQIFENTGELMGCSNPHPHGQIWAQHSIPAEAARESECLRAHHERHGRTLLEDYAALETQFGERIVCANDGWLALVPFWAAWPFETLVVPRRPAAHLGQLHGDEQRQLAELLPRLTSLYDRLFNVSFPYSAGIHQAPTDGREHPEWHLHLHFYPPLLRSATVRKFAVGYEMLAEPQRDLTPEAAAVRLRALAGSGA